MSFVGKVLVFLNLIFSVVTSALIVMVFTTRTSWKNEYEKVKNLALVAEAAFRAEKTQHENDIKGKDEQVRSLQLQLDQNKNLIASKDAALKEVQDKFGALESTNSKETSNQEKLVKQVESLKAEREALQGDLNKREALIVEKTKEANDFKKQSVQNDINFKATQNRLEDLLKNYEQLARQYSDLQKQTGIAGGGPSGSGSPNEEILKKSAPPAPQDVTGRVDYVNNPSRLAQISIGSDQGLQQGTELQVYRVDASKPQDSKYLGVLTITKVAPKAAVGTFAFKGSGTDKNLKEGDVVSASISGK